ncbi:MAG: ferritin [Bacteroidales bacterium]|nr:ferritin [Bacteroidales bacterium]
MLNTKVEQFLNRQVEREEYSANLYISMAVWAEVNGFSGVADWLYAQAEEERLHMLKFVKYINERGGRALIGAVAQPPSDFKNVKSLFEEVLKHEQFISQSINEIIGVCIDERDFTSQNWLQFFVNEQIEEEASVQKIIDKLKLIGDGNLYMLDRDIMSLRTTTAQ